MNFLIISHVPHKYVDGRYYAYAPYVREMNVWLKFADRLTIVAPSGEEPITAVEEYYVHADITFTAVPSFNLLGTKAILKTMIALPLISMKIVHAMRAADHIHLRCPGNMGLMGCIFQVFFPTKIKTAKYAGNWDPLSGQPRSYRLQRRILNNTFITRNITVLVYGEWADSSVNIKPFFTATYRQDEIMPLTDKMASDIIRFVFAGGLFSGKNAAYAVKIIENLIKNGKPVCLDIYGDGHERNAIEKYITQNQLQHHVILHGNQNKEVLKEAYRQSQFVILPSESEGWPKAIAEGMFWGCIPIATPVSCVPYMLDSGRRGLLLSMNLSGDTVAISTLIEDKEALSYKSNEAAAWSRHFTIDIFEEEIKKLLQP